MSLLARPEGIGPDGAPDPAQLFSTDKGFSAILPQTQHATFGDKKRAGSDTVQVITGTKQDKGGDKGKQGKVLKVFTETNRVLVEGINRVYVYPRRSGTGTVDGGTGDDVAGLLWATACALAACWAATRSASW